MNSKNPNAELLKRIGTSIVFFFRPVIEGAKSIQSNNLVTMLCIFWAYAACFLVLARVDLWALNHFHLGGLRPERWYLKVLYVLPLMSLGFYIRGILATRHRQRLLNRLTDVFIASGLKNNLGKLPSFVFDNPIDDFTRKLRLKRANLTQQDFEKAKPAVESGLQVYIDEVRENREKDTVDIIYSSTPMPNSWHIHGVEPYKKWTVAIGKTRSQTITCDLKRTPHLLIAGLTGGGKSTFLRQLITTLYLNNPSTTFTLVDLKGGLEFQLFEKLGPRVSVISDLERAVSKFDKMDAMLEKRMAMVKAQQCKDIDALIQKDPKVLKAIDPADGTMPIAARHVVVIDEAAEVFLTGPSANAKETQKAKRVLSQIARQGRSVGLHLIVATQRPDTKSLDPQIKANLPGILCFRMANDASSMTVLGNGRATDLSQVPGRAIWKEGANQIEVQTPYLDPAVVDELLANKKVVDQKPEPDAVGKSVQVTTPDMAVTDAKNDEENETA